jgi:hypothetical protein
MERPAEWDDDIQLPSGDALAEFSPLLQARARSLFQRIERRRSAYFADVEDGPEIYEDEESNELAEKKQKCENEAKHENPGRNQVGSSLPSSDFADLSTWCCDVLLPRRRQFISLGKLPAQHISLADQPTMVLSCLAASSLHLADLPTMPLLFAAPCVAIRHGLFSRSLFRLIEKKRQAWDVSAHLCQSLWRVGLCGTRHILRLYTTRRRTPEGHELLMERLRERERRGELLTPPGGQRAPLVRPPLDRLFG